MPWNEQAREMQNRDEWEPLFGVSAREIETFRTAAGGWTRATLAGWDVPWPPPKGWKRRLEQLYEETAETVGRSLRS